MNSFLALAITGIIAAIVFFLGYQYGFQDAINKMKKIKFRK